MPPDEARFSHSEYVHAPSSAEIDQERREASAERYMAKFAGWLHDIDLAIIGIETHAPYDSSAREAALGLRQALEEATVTLKSGAE